MGLRNRFRYVRRSGSSSSTRAQVCRLPIERVAVVGDMTTTHLTNALQYAYCMLEIPDVKDRDDEFDVCIVPDTVDGGEATRFAVCALLCCALRDFERAQSEH